MLKITNGAATAIIALAAIIANLGIANYTRATTLADHEQAWKSQVEQRLTRVETKLDRLLNVTQAALDAGRRLPKLP